MAGGGDARQEGLKVKSEIVTLIIRDFEASAAVFVVSTWAAGLETIGHYL